MRIHEIVIDNFKVIGHLTLNELPQTGVIVIAGDNEQGKSTIMEAIDTVLNYKHTSKAGNVRAIQPVGQDVPSAVSLKITVGEITLRITKQFNRKASSTLDVLSPRTENFTGTRADDRLAEILADNVDEQLLSTLFMRQGEVETGIQAVGIPSLAQALDGEDGDSGVEDTELTEAARREYLRYYTAKGKESGELRKAREGVAAAEQELAEARADVGKLSGYVDNVARLTAERDRAEQAMPATREDLVAKEVARSEAEQVKVKFDALTEELDRAAESRERAQADQQRRTVLRSELAELRETLALQSRSLPEIRDRAAREAETITALSAELAQARETEDEVAEDLKAAKTTHRLVTQQDRRAELDELLRQVAELDDKLKAVGDTPALSDEQLAAVEKAATELSVQRRLRETLTAKLTLRAEDPQTISVDDEDIEVGTDAQVIELAAETTVRIGTVTAEFTPGAKSGADTVEEAERGLSGLLRELDCEDVAEVRRRNDDTHRVAEATASLERERSNLLKRQEPTKLRRELDALELALAETAVPELSVTEAAAAVEQAEEAVAQAQSASKLIESKLDPWREKRNAHELTVIQTRLEAAQGEVDRKAASLAELTAERSDADLDQAVADAAASHAEVAARRDAAKVALDAADLDLATQLYEGAKTKLAGLEDTVSGAKEELARLTGYIEQATGADERLGRAESEFEAASNRLASVERRAAAAQLLVEVLDRHRDQARSRYAAPFTAELTKLARTVFGPEVQFDLDDQLQVAARSIGERSVPLESLSGGAKEQLAILTRFAIARLVADGETSVPVFVDDALGSTDPGRLDRMAALFSQAGRSSQVFVLTCVPQRYESVTGKLEYRIEELKSLPVG